MSPGPGPSRHRARGTSARAALRALLLLGSLAALPAAEPAPTTLGKALAALRQLPELSPADLTEGLLDRSVAVILPPDAPRAALLQALACATGARFRLAGAGALGRHLPPPPPSVARVHPSAVRDRALRAPVQRLLAPWWSSACGLDHDAEHGDWAATLPSTGHERLEEILSLLDLPRAGLPPALVAPGTPHPSVVLGVTTWAAVAARTGAPVAASDAWPAVPIAATVGDLVPALARAGVPAAWVHGALCLGDPRDRQEAAESVRIACLPLPPRVDPARIDPGWSEPGWNLLIHGGMVLAVAPPAALHGLQERLDALDRGDLP